MPHIHHIVVIGATAEIVYQALSSREGLSAWWTPDTTATAEAGSIARFTFGAGYYKEMKIELLKPSEYVSWLCINGATEWIGTQISFELQTDVKQQLFQLHPEAGDQLHQQQNKQVTILNFRHNNWKEDSAMYAECNYTWGQFLKSLKLYCETGKGRPWPTQHLNIG